MGKWGIIFAILFVIGGIKIANDLSSDNSALPEETEEQKTPTKMRKKIQDGFQSKITNKSPPRNIGERDYLPSDSQSLRQAILAEDILPKPKHRNFQYVFGIWKRTMNRENFDYRAMPYKKGTMYRRIKENGAILGYQGHWKTSDKSCSLRIFFNKAWRYTRSYSECGSLPVTTSH